MPQTKFTLEELNLPKAWYNVLADLPVALQPVLHPETKHPIGPDDLAPGLPDGGHPPGAGPADACAHLLQGL